MNSHDNPYEFIDRNVEAVQTTPDAAPVNRERALKDIENGMIDDTLNLINILDGSTEESENLLAGERQSESAFDAAIYLDKSGRPVRLLAHELWQSESNESEPSAYFLNIDKRPWLGAMGFRDTKDTNLQDINADDVSLEKIDPEHLHKELTAIRALFLKPVDRSRLDESNLEGAWSLPTQFDGRTIAIVDEVKSSGNTLRVAVELLKRAIPEANFEGMWWSNPGMVYWEGGEDVGHKRQFSVKNVPPWYDATRESGRGIGDIDIPYSRNSPNKAQRIGATILSAPERDSLGNRSSHRTFSSAVRRDIGKLAARYKNKELVDYKPSVHLDEDMYDERIESYYGEPAENVYSRWRSQQGRR